MCITPRDVYQRIGGVFVPYAVACRHCWQCKSRRVWDWVGRAIAENETATKSFFVTLTYGNTNRYGEDLSDRAKSLHYADIQKWLKRIREKHVVRYVVTGEYGPKKGRAHWHALLFFRGAVPDVKTNYKYWGNREFNTDPFWKDGQTTWMEFHPHQAKYVCKYMLKAEDGEDSSERKAMLSKKPPLGHDYFMQRAEKYVEAGLSPQDLRYHFPEVKWGKKNPQPREYVLQGVSAENFIGHFVQKWRDKYGRDSWPYSEVIEEYIDREIREQVERRRHAHVERKQSLQRPWYVPPQAFDPSKPCKLFVDGRLNLWAISDPSLPQAARLYWSYNEDGFSGWHDVPNLVTEAKAKTLREAFASLQPPPGWSPEPKAVRARRARGK